MFLQVANGLGVGIAAGLEAQIDEDAMAAPEGIVQLLNFEPRGVIDAEVDHHLFAPEGPAFVKDGMGEEAAPFAGVLIGDDELEMMTWVGFVGAGERQSEVLSALGFFFGVGVFGEAEVVDPEDTALAFFKGAWAGVSGGGEEGSHEVGDGFDFEGIAGGKGDGAGFFEPVGDAGGFLLIEMEEIGAGVPLSAGAGDDGVGSFIFSKGAASGEEEMIDPGDFGEGEGFDLADGIIEAEFIADAALEFGGADGEGTFWSGRAVEDDVAVAFEGVLGGLDAIVIGLSWSMEAEEGAEGLEEGGCAGGTLFHDFAPGGFGPIDEPGGIGEVGGDLAENGAEVSSGAGGFIIAANEFMEEEVEDLFDSGGFESMPVAGVIVDFAEEAGAQGEAIEMLIRGKVGGGNGIEGGESFLAAAFLFGLEAGIDFAEFAFAGRQAGDVGEDGMIVEEGFEVSIEEMLEFRGRDSHGGKGSHETEEFANKFGDGWTIGWGCTMIWP